jgi:hypothetical protein
MTLIKKREYIDALKSKLPEIKTKLATILVEVDLGTQRSWRCR